jgi:hypothetical protein
MHSFAAIVGLFVSLLSGFQALAGDYTEADLTTRSLEATTDPKPQGAQGNDSTESVSH